MSGLSKNVRVKSTFAAYVCLCISLGLVVLMGVWGAYRDLQLVHLTRLNAEISKLRAQATRRAGHLEEGLANEMQGESIDWETMRDGGWLARYWQGVKLHREEQLYAAIVVDGLIVFHTNPETQNRSLGSRWYENSVDEAGDDVVLTCDEFLAGARPTYDVRVPIEIRGREVASYHEGLSASWVDQQATGHRGRILSRWLLVIGGILGVVALAIVSLLLIIRRKGALQNLADVAEMRRVEEVGQLAAGFAHEIRNPLHAIGLNLHAFRKVVRGEAKLDDEETARMIEQSSKEIDRVEHLMNELLGFASPKEARHETIDLKAELKATLDFIEQELMHKKLNVSTDFPANPMYVQMDAARLRQVLLNLLVNAQDAVDEAGHISVSLRRRHHRAEITISDDGPGVSQEDLKRIFEPFYSTKDEGSGLGLALVQRFVEEAGGEIDCESNGAAGATFRIRLPLLSEGKRK